MSDTELDKTIEELEAEVLAELEEAGFRIDQRLGLGTEVIYEATANGMVDVYLEYSGTVWANRMNETSNPGRKQVLEKAGNFVEENDGMLSLIHI